MLVDFMPNEEKPRETQRNTAPVGGKKPSEQKEKQPTGGQTFEIKLLKDVVYVLLLVMFIGFAGMFVATSAMLWSAWKDKQGSYESLKDKILEQNYKIDELNKTANLVCKTWRKDCP